MNDAHFVRDKKDRTISESWVMNRNNSSNSNNNNVIVWINIDLPSRFLSLAIGWDDDGS